MRYLHIRNIEKYHPSYKDRSLIWAKIHCSMVQGDPDCELITDEIDWARLIKFILLELQAKKPIPLDDEYLTRKGFNLKKRPISLTLEMLHSFVDIVTDSSKVCVVEKSREEKSRVEEPSVTESYMEFEKTILNQWNEFCSKHSILSKIMAVTGKRRLHLRKRYEVQSFHAFDAILIAVEKQPFLLGENDRKWKVSFDWLIENDTNYIKVLEMKYNQNNSNIREGF